jgi:DNA-binding NarL/FixJ family response regulator
MSDLALAAIPSTPCREWRGAKTRQGYGRKSVGGRVVRAHRWVVAQIDGWDAIKSKVVMHLCDNPSCYRYDHLAIGTQSDNIRMAFGRGRKENPKAKLLPEQIADIFRRRSAGETQQAIADAMGVTQTTVSKVLLRRTWKEID